MTSAADRLRERLGFLTEGPERFEPERAAYLTPHGTGRGWTPEQRAEVRRIAIYHSLHEGLSLVPRGERETYQVIDAICGVVEEVLDECKAGAWVDSDLETALEALWVRAVHAGWGQTQRAEAWKAHAAGLLGETP